MIGQFSYLIQFAILVGWMGAMLRGSIMAIRGRRMWATSMLVIGSACILVGPLGSIAGMMFFRRSIRYTVPDIMEVIIALAGILLIVATISIVGFRARFGVAEKRAEELEGLGIQL